MIYLHNHSKLWAFLSNGFNSRFWGVLLLWLLGKCKRLTVTQKEAQKETSQSLQKTPSIECCIHTPTEFGVGYFFWKHEATSPKKEARSHQRQNNHKTHHGSHGLFLAGKSSSSKSFPHTRGPQGSSLPGCHQPGHGPGHEVLLAQTRHSTASQRGFVQVGNLWREVQSTGGNWTGPRRGGPDPRGILRFCNFCTYRTFYVIVFLMQKPS